MARAALKPSRAVAELLRRKREDLGFSLREIEKRTAEAGELIPFPTLARVEQGRVDPGLRRLQTLLRLYGVPFQLISDLVELEEFAGRLPKGRNPEKLFEEGIALWKNGETRKALACLIAMEALSREMPEHTPFRKKAVVAFAIMVGALGKYHLSLDLVGKVLADNPERSVLISALIQAGRCWRQLGAYEVALAYLERAEKHLGADAHKERAWVHHLRASTLLDLGELEEASKALTKALASYRLAKDVFGESQALAIKPRILQKQGDGPGALRAVEDAVRHAEQNQFKRLVILRRIDEGRVLIHLGEAGRSIATLRAALAASVVDGDRHAEFHVHHALWKAHLALGQREQAAFELGAARHYLQHVDEASEEADEVRALTPKQHARKRAARRQVRSESA